jgi:ArsR family transcriptional regulator
MKINCHKNKKTQQNSQKIVDFLKVISEENRLKILCILKKQETCVCEIWQYLNLPQNLTSHHLKVLKNFGLICSKRKGAKIFYKINFKNFSKNLELLNKFI